jgi:hypothetical protein
MADHLPELMTPAQAAAWLQVAVRTLEDWRAANVGPPFSKVRQTIRYRRTALEAWIAAQEQAVRRASGSALEGDLNKSSK